ncbi:carboxypeptidase regulatory-like domain-containing protein, partial [Photobacterium phosphoreum]|uniref:carboxypeptidase regulatory-like domain-containing protein n=1 Tax=Photobacterium phosphoreum TaxID=659 RepID=UPI000D4D03B3
MAIKRINYPRWNNIFTIFFLSFLLSACGGGDGEDVSPNPSDEKYSIVTKQIKLNASPSCPYGGITIETGIDSNGNGLLDTNEISDSQAVCHGASSLIKLLDEPQGSNCSSGGKKIISGIDSNGNGLLDDGEYEVQGFICNGSDGSITTPSIPKPSPLGRISGYIDPSILPIKSYARSRSAISTLSSGNVASTAVITSECISGVVDSPQKAIDKRSPLIIDPIEIPVDSTGYFSVDVPACDDYSLIIVNEDQGYKQENISVGSSEEVQLTDINEGDLKPTGSVTFKLLSEYNNTPISNAQVVFYPLLDNAISDKNGVISINGLPAGNYSAVINHSTFVRKALDFQIISDKITDKENVILSMEKGSATGKVSAEGIDNIANIPLYLRAIDGTIYTALTNESGIYRFNNLPTGDGYSVIASPNDFVARKVDNIKIESNITTLIDSILLVRELKDNGNIVGFALYSDRVSSNNHAGILVSIEGTDKEAITGRDGSFVFTGISAGEYILNINDSNYISLSKNIKVMKNSTITLDPITIISKTGSLSGSVIDENKKPISNIDVLLMPNGFMTKTSSDGTFRFSNIPISNYTLEINENGYHKISSLVSIPVESINEEVILSTPFELLPIIFSGKVTSQDKGLANASVILSGGKLSSDISVKTSLLGDFEFYRLAAGNYKLEINADGYTSLTLTVSLSGDDNYVLPYDINLERTYGVLSGIVTLADETDSSGITVSISEYTQNIVTDSTGQWQVTLPSGLYNGRVTYTKSGYITHSTEEQFTIEALQTVNLTTVKLNKVTGSIVGVVVNENGEKLSGVVVVDKQNAAQFITDEQGRYQFTNVAVGEHQLSIEKAAFVSQQQTVLVEEGKEVTVPETVLIARKLMGTVTDGEKGIADVVITLVSGGGAQTAITTQSNNNGEFIFSGVNVGSHQIKISKSGYKGVQSLILIPDVAEYKIPQIELVAVQGMVKGVTTLSKRTDHAGINVKLNDMPYSTSTDAVGAWSLSLPLGNYSQGVIFSKELYETKTYDKTLVINEFGEFNIGAVNLAQTHSVIRFNVSADNSCPSELSVTFKGDNFNAKYPITNGIFEATLPLGIYHYTIACSTTGWETIIDTVTLNEGLELIELSDHILRRSYVVINNGQIVTNDSMLNLAIGHSDAVLMNITESNNSTGWITFKEQYYLDVGNTDGKKTVTVQFRDNNGTDLSSQTDSILLDTQIDVNSFIADGATTKGDQLTLKLDLNGELNATVTANLPGVFEDLKLLDNGAGGDLSANDGIYERIFVITTPKEINAYVSAEIVDLATNTKTLNSAQKVVLSTDPTINNIDVESNVQNGTMSIRFTTDEPTTTYINYGIKADQLTTKLNVSDVFSQNHNVTLNDLNSNQTVWYRITATDAANNIGYKQGSNKLAPSMINNIVAYAGNEEIGLIWDKSQVKSVIGYRLYRSEDDGISYVVVNPEMLIKETYFNDLAVTNDTNYTYYVTALDANDNESMPSLTASATPKLILAGPTNVNGGIIQQNEVWLKSRSPYQLTANMKISEQTKLVLLPGTEIVFVGDETIANGDVNQRYIQVAGQLFGYGTEKQPITIHTTDNVVYPYFEFSNSDSDGIKEYTNYIQFTHTNIDSVTIKNGGYTEFNNVNMRMANITSSYRYDYIYVELAVDSVFIDASGYKSESQDCQYDENSHWVCENIESWADTRNYNFIVSEANNVVFKHEYQSYLDTLSEAHQRQLSVTVDRGDKLNLGAGIYKSNYLNNSILNNVSISALNSDTAN